MLTTTSIQRRMLLYGLLAAGLLLATEPLHADAGNSIPAQTPEHMAIEKAGDAYLRNLPKDRYRVTPEEFLHERAQGKRISLIDVREPDEFARGHIEGAQNFPLRTLMQHLNEIPRNQPVLLYCHSARRSTHALVILHLLGYDHVRHLRGGYAGYRKYIDEHPEENQEPAGETKSSGDDEEEDMGC